MGVGHRLVDFTEILPNMDACGGAYAVQANKVPMKPKDLGGQHSPLAYMGNLVGLHSTDLRRCQCFDRDGFAAQSKELHRISLSARMCHAANIYDG